LWDKGFRDQSTFPFERAISLSSRVRTSIRLPLLFVTRFRPGDLAKASKMLENDPVRTVHRDQAIMLELRDFTGDRLDREAQVVSNVKASERDFDLDRSHHAGIRALRHVEKKSGNALLGGSASETNDLILRRFHLPADLSVELESQVRTLLDEVIEAVTRKASEPNGGHGLSREQIIFAS
jgi:hypothetical protein